MKKELILLYGGRSGEHEVSCRSAASVYNHLDREKYNITLIGISRDGQWMIQDNPVGEVQSLDLISDDERSVSIIPMKGLAAGDRFIRPDVIFPVTHGTFGEDGTLQGLCEMCGFPYVGATVGGSYLGMDKEMAKTVWQRKGLDVIPFLSSGKREYYENRKVFEEKVLGEYGLPLFVKPSTAGSSVGISRVENSDLLGEALDKAFLFDTKAVVEPAVTGREVECSVIGNHETESFPPGEIAPTHAFYDYEAKYIDPDGAGLIIPAEIGDEKAAELRTVAEKAYKALGLRGFARVDFFIDESGRILLNEVNTLPGFTNISMFSMMCDVGGLPYAELLDRLVILAEEQFAEKNALKFTYN